MTSGGRASSTDAPVVGVSHLRTVCLHGGILSIYADAIKQVQNYKVNGPNLYFSSTNFLELFDARGSHKM
ncbi:hypothetical protein OK016_03140 [Vibrio chagasii]|nr:hypothetical protein [Vibrio chagasii]